MPARRLYRKNSWNWKKGVMTSNLVGGSSGNFLNKTAIPMGRKQFRVGLNSDFSDDQLAPMLAVEE
jgi:hypothetical protein